MKKNKIDKFTKICEYAASRDEVKKVYNDSYSSRIGKLTRFLKTSLL